MIRRSRISQSDLAARIGITAPTLRKFEKHGEIPLPQFVQLLNILGLGGKVESLLAEKHPAELEAEWNANKKIPTKRPYNREHAAPNP